MICPKCGLEVAENAVICIGCGTKTETFSEKKENQKDTEGEILGSTSCEHCGVRIRVPKTKQNLVGNIIKCPRCSEKFTLQM
ncbi:MAG: zinc-ribbon domain-containing protein [Desulfococcaceae bacterium]